MDDRAATETLGMVLLLALVILLATTIGLGLLAQTSAIEEGTERSYVNIDPTLNTSALTLTHAGGPSFQTSGLTLVLQNEVGREEFELDDPSLTESGLDDGSFETGDSVTASHSFRGYVDISLYSSETNERLYRAVLSTDQSDISTPSAGSGSPPTARIVALDSVAEGFSISFDGSQSSDPDGNETISSYSWGISGNGSVIVNGSDPANATYQAPTDIDGDENVTVQLTVTDDDGNTDTETFEVTIVDTDTAEAPEDADGDGSAFNDTNGNGVYDEGEDIVSKDDLEDGYNDPHAELVIYPSVGEIKPTGNSGGGGLGNGGGGGGVNQVDITVKTITAGSDFTANGANVSLTATGDIRIDDTNLSSTGNNGITITSMNGRIFTNRTTMTANGGGDIQFNSNGDIYLESADLDAGSYNADLTVTTATLYVDQASIDGTLFYDPNGITVNGSTSQGSVSQ